MCDHVNQTNRTDARFVFAPLIATWSALAVRNHTPWVQTNANSSKAARCVAPIANCAKKVLIGLAYAVATIALGLFSIASLPFRCCNRPRPTLNACQIDINRLTKAEKAELEAEITNYVATHGTNLTPAEKKDFAHKIMVYYARSNKVYGPVARAWTDYLLEKANKANMKLVFMARDGTPIYKMALKLMQSAEYQKKYPNLVGDKKIVLGYFSRAVVFDSESSPEKTKLFQEYAETEVGIQKGDKCLFIDVGIAGSMINPIKALLPNADINFEYLISMTDKAPGFISSKEHSLNSVPYHPTQGWGGNIGGHWVEDSHQGVLTSPSSLVKVGKRIFPNTKQPNKKQYEAPKNSLEFMLRRFSHQAIVRCHKNAPISQGQLVQARTLFDDTLNQIKQCVLPLFIVHKKK